jgi:hypothetical protein
MGPAAISSKVPGADTSIQKQRGPNPQTDYKRHFNRTKERFDVVTLVSTSTAKSHHLSSQLFITFSIFSRTGANSQTRRAGQSQCETSETAGRARVSDVHNLSNGYGIDVEVI